MIPFAIVVLCIAVVLLAYLQERRAWLPLGFAVFALLLVLVAAFGAPTLFK